MTATAVGCAAAAALSVTVLPVASALAGPAAALAPRAALAADPCGSASPSDSASPSGSPSASDSPSPSGSPSPTDSPSASGSPSPSESPSPSAPAVPSVCASTAESASPSASLSPTPSFPAGPPILTFRGPSRATTGDIVTLTGRVLGPDRRPAPLQTPVVITALDWRRPPSATRVVDRPTIFADGTFTVFYPVTRSVVLTATAMNTGSVGEKVSAPRLTIAVRGHVLGARLRIVHGKLAASAALTPGQQVPVKGVYAGAGLYLVTAKGTILRRLAAVAVRSRPSGGRTTITFPLVAVPPPGSRVRIFVIATQVLPASSPVLKVPVLPRPARRPASRPPTPSGGVHSVF